MPPPSWPEAPLPHESNWRAVVGTPSFWLVVAVGSYRVGTLVVVVEKWRVRCVKERRRRDIETLIAAAASISHSTSFNQE